MLAGVYFYILIQQVFISYQDFKTKKILNLWSLSNIISYLLFLFIFPDAYNFDVATFTLPITFFLIGLFLYSLNIMGAGDVKYITTLLLIIPTNLHMSYLEMLTVSTIFVGALLLIYKLKRSKYFDHQAIWGSQFSYAPVILLSWISLGWRMRII